MRQVAVDDLDQGTVRLDMISYRCDPTSHYAQSDLRRVRLVVVVRPVLVWHVGVRVKSDGSTSHCAARRCRTVAMVRSSRYGPGAML